MVVSYDANDVKQKGDRKPCTVQSLSWVHGKVGTNIYLNLHLVPHLCPLSCVPVVSSGISSHIALGSTARASSPGAPSPVISYIGDEDV